MPTLAAKSAAKMGHPVLFLLSNMGHPSSAGSPLHFSPPATSLERSRWLGTLLNDADVIYRRCGRSAWSKSSAHIYCDPAICAHVGLPEELIPWIGHWAGIDCHSGRRARNRHSCGGTASGGQRRSANLRGGS